MKKLVVLCAVLAAVCSGAFAEISWGGGGRAIFIPFGVQFANPDKDDTVRTYFGAENPWSGNGVRIGLYATGSRAEGNMGFNLSFYVEKPNGDAFPAIDDSSANVWIKPFGGIFETFKFTFGIFNIDTMRYKFAGAGSSFHNYIWYARGDMTSEDDTFRRFQSKGFGSHFPWEPVKGLWIGWGLGSVGNARSFAGEFKEDGWLHAMAASQVAVGYTIENIGLARVQFIGPVIKNKIAETKAAGDTPAEYGLVNQSLDVPLGGTGDPIKIQGAFNLTAVQGLNLDFGFSIPIAYERDYWDDADKTNLLKSVKTQDDYVVSLGFDLTMFNPFRLWGLMSLKVGGYTENTPNGGDSTKTNRGTDFAIHLTPMYTVAPNNILGLDLFMDVRAGSDDRSKKQDNDPTVNPGPDAKNDYLDLGFGVYYRRNIAGGDIRVAVTMKVPGVWGEGHEGAKPQLFVPIMFNYNF
jgi:hypothetical protein